MESLDRPSIVTTTNLKYTASPVSSDASSSSPVPSSSLDPFPEPFPPELLYKFADYLNIRQQSPLEETSAFCRNLISDLRSSKKRFILWLRSPSLGELSQRQQALWTRVALSALDSAHSPTVTSRHIYHQTCEVYGRNAGLSFNYFLARECTLYKATLHNISELILSTAGLDFQSLYRCDAYRPKDSTGRSTLACLLSQFPKLTSLKLIFNRSESFTLEQLFPLLGALLLEVTPTLKHLTFFNRSALVSSWDYRTESYSRVDEEITESLNKKADAFYAGLEELVLGGLEGPQVNSLFRSKVPHLQRLGLIQTRLDTLMEQLKALVNQSSEEIPTSPAQQLTHLTIRTFSQEITKAQASLKGSSSPETPVDDYLLRYIKENFPKVQILNGVAI